MVGHQFRVLGHLTPGSSILPTPTTDGEQVWSLRWSEKPENLDRNRDRPPSDRKL